MIHVEFAPSLRRHIDCPPQTVPVGSLQFVLDTALLAAPELRHYVFNDQGHVRKHVAVFINKHLLSDRTRLDTVLQPGDRILVIQALSGG